MIKQQGTAGWVMYQASADLGTTHLIVASFPAQRSGNSEVKHRS